MLRQAFFATALLLACCLAQRPANAYWGYDNFGYGYGWPSGWYLGVNNQVPPYFALYPPVYYSGQIVRIPYGASPFAYPWGTPFSGAAAPVVSSPAVALATLADNTVAESVVVENEFYGQAEGKLPAPKPNGNAKPGLEKQGQSQGVMILNPYYQAQSHVASRK